MQRRGVSVGHVYDALSVPDKFYEDVEHGVGIAVKKVNDKFVIVAFEEEDGAVKVITLYYTVKFDKLVKSKMVRGAWKRVK